MMSVFGVYAQDVQDIIPYGVAECRADITLYKTSGEFWIEEDESGDSIYNPDTAKRINGHYIAENQYGNRATQSVQKSLQSGQLWVTKTAPSGYTSYYGFMRYYLNNQDKGTVSKYYNH